MTNTKITNRLVLTYALDILPADAPEGYREKLENMIAQLDKKNSSSGTRKPTARQAENDELSNVILASVTTGHLYTITDLIRTIPALHDMPTQRVTPIVNRLVNSGNATREKKSGKTLFSFN